MRIQARGGWCERIVLTVALVTSGHAWARTGDCAYQEEGGLLVVELESGAPGGQWMLETAVAGYAGSGYLRWDGPDRFNTPGDGLFGFDFDIHQGGFYWFSIRNHHDHQDSTLENDVWVRMDGGPWTKAFSSIAHQWTWKTNFDYGTSKPAASYDLTPGRHRIEFSGRSHDFRMDRFHLYVPGHPLGNSTSAPESDCEGSNEPPVAKIRISPPSVPADDDHRTVITLDSRGSWDPNGDPIDVRWSVRGAEFVDGTSARSAVARITIPGGRAWPVQLTVTDQGHPPMSRRAHAVINVTDGAGEVRGAAVAWHPMEVWLQGPRHHQGDVGPNPFLDYRMTVTFRGPNGAEYVVPGFFDGDGEGGPIGSVWKARFAPDAAGIWDYRVSFRAGEGVALSQNDGAGVPTGFDGAQGSVLVAGRDEDAEGFLSKGRIEYVGEHYLKFRDGPYFLKGGTDSPENLFGYLGFSDIADLGGIGILHEYEPHRGDWNHGDPEFVSSNTGSDARGLIGALNYLGEQGVNSVYFLPMNLGGDGQDTCPFVSYQSTHFAKTHYHLPRMHQWLTVLEHAQRQGIFVQFVLAETEPLNESWLDGGNLGVERKLFYREMVARFGHLLGVKWNLSEENDYDVEELRSFAAYLDYWDAYDHPIAVHTRPNEFSDYQALLGDPLFSATSIQYSPEMAGSHVQTWRTKSAQAGRKWVLDMDENNPWDEGLTDENADELRRAILWDVYLSGGQLEWYFGAHPLPLGDDLSCEDFRTRESMWRYMRIARGFLEEHLPFWEMQPTDHLLTGESGMFGGGEVFAKQGHVYAVYLPMTDVTGSLDLGGVSGTFRARWWNPRQGGFEGAESNVSGGGARPLGPPPSTPNQDWVWLLEKK